MMIEEIFRKVKPIYGQKIDRLWQAYIIEDTDGKKEIETILQLLYTKALNQEINNQKILLEPPSKEIAAGEHRMGHVIYNGKRLFPFALRENEFIQHVGIFGRSGSGKTNTAIILIAHFLNKNKPFLIFDWKRNYRDLIRHTSKEMLIFTVGRKMSPFTFNPLIPPPGTSPRIWLKKLIEIIGHSYFVGEGVMYLLQKAIDEAYRQFGIYSYTEQKTYPTLSDVLRILEATPAKGRESLWMSSTLRAIGALCFGGMGKVLNSPQQTDMEKLLKKNVVLELDSLTDSDKTFLIESLLLWIHHYRLVEGRREEFKHAIIIEEAHHILLRKKQEMQGAEAITDVILREIREFGESVILIDQHPSLISIPALGNTYTSIIMNLKHRADVNMAADCILLDQKEKDYIGMLEVGQVIVKLQGRWCKPFLIQIPHIPIQKGKVTDLMVKERMAGYFANSKTFQTPKPQINRIYPPDRKDREKEFRKHGITPPIPEAERPLTLAQISEAEKSLLKDITEYPLAGVVERYKRLNWSRRRGNYHKDIIIRRGLVIPVSVTTKSGRVVLLKPTYKAIELLRKEGIDTRRDQRKGGIVHEFWKHKLAEYYRNKNFEVEIEKPIGEGKSIDILIKKEDFISAIEIETGKSDTLWNVEKDQKAGYQNIIIVVTSGEAETKIKEQLKRKGLDADEKIKVIPTNSFDI